MCTIATSFSLILGRPAPAPLAAEYNVVVTTPGSEPKNIIWKPQPKVTDTLIYQRPLKFLLKIV
jgi:hypothetical protein